MIENSATPLLAEELALVLFDPKSGTFAGEGHNLFHVLAGALLTDLAIAKQIEVKDTTFWRGNEVHVVDDVPPADPILKSVWERAAKKPTEVHSLILEVGPYQRAKVVDRLVERGHIKEVRRRFLGLIPSTALVDGGTSRRAGLVHNIRSVLVDGTEPDLRTGALTGLLSASGSLPMLDREIPWSGAVYTRGQELQKGDWGAAAAGEAVARTAAAILTNSLFVTVTLPGTRDS
ncbi:MAG: GOLPH3/VPS74 family protein [Rhodococcus sp. (in: high G+C Gram-positive bacteria)]